VYFCVSDYLWADGGGFPDGLSLFWAVRKIGENVPQTPGVGANSPTILEAGNARRVKNSKSAIWV